MGCGKTAVGAALAKALGAIFVDTDQLIAERAGKSIPEIFAQDGEVCFRELETGCLAGIMDEYAASRSKKIVVATGGGLPLSERNQLLLKQGVVFFLDVGVQSVYDRTEGDDSRPLLAAKTAQQRMAAIERLHTQRHPIYSQVADHSINVDDRSIPEIVKEIMRYL
jgi:shikimate kinase